MIETIAIYYTPIAATRIMAKLGFGVAYHMSIVYTDSDDHHYGATSGPSNQAIRLGPSQAVKAMIDAAVLWPSPFGHLVSDLHNNTPFETGSPRDFYTQDAYGTAYPPFVVIRGVDLSARWQTILRTYAAVDALDLPYSPISQNSNSLAGTALRRARIEIPFSSATEFAPALFVELPIK